MGRRAQDLALGVPWEVVASLMWWGRGRNRSQLGGTVEEPPRAACTWTLQEAALAVSIHGPLRRSLVVLSLNLKEGLSWLQEISKSYLTKGGVRASLLKPERWPVSQVHLCAVSGVLMAVSDPKAEEGLAHRPHVAPVAGIRAAPYGKLAGITWR